MNEPAPIVIRNNVKEKLARNELVTSMAVRLVQNVNIASMAVTAGFDSFYVDMEHSSISADSTSQMCSAALNIGIAPFVRVGSVSPGTIAGVLDGGALGVIAPQVRSADEAREIVAAAKYPPLGERSVSSTIPQLNFRAIPATEALPALNDSTMVVAMLETTSALEDIDAIAGTEGIDMLLIGSNDLASELGIPGQCEHKLMLDACSRTIDACLSHGKHVGIGGISLSKNADLMADLISKGVRYISVSTDVGFLMAAAADSQQRVRSLCH